MPKETSRSKGSHAPRGLKVKRVLVPQEVGYPRDSMLKGLAAQEGLSCS